MFDQVACRESGEGAVAGEVGPQHRACDRGTELAQCVLQSGRRQMDDRDRLAQQGQRRAHGLECRLIGDGEVADLPARGGAQPRQVNRQPLLQLTRSDRCDEGGARRAAADVDQQAGAVGLGAGADERRGGGLRAARPADRGSEDRRRAHRPAGLAKAVAVTAR